MFKYIKDYVYTPPRAYILRGGMGEAELGMLDKYVS